MKLDRLELLPSLRLLYRTKLTYRRTNDISNMSVAPLSVLVPLGVVTLLGIGFTAFGYRLVSHFLRWTGWLGGASVGGVVAWQLLPQLVPSLTTQQQLTWGVGLVIGGAILGRLLLPAATRLAAMIAGFVATAGAVGLFFLGDSVLRQLRQVDPTTAPAASLEAIAGSLSQALLGSQGLEVIGIIAAAGIVGAIVATRYHTELIAVGITAAGAVLLGAAVPLWQAALSGSVELGVGIASASLLWTLVALAAGLVIQLVDQRRDTSDENPFATN